MSLSVWTLDFPVATVQKRKTLFFFLWNIIYLYKQRKGWKQGEGVQEWRKEIGNKLWDKDEKNQVTAYKKDQC